MCSMKKLILLAGAFFIFTGLHAQENATLQQGTVLEYYVLPGGGFLKASLILERVSTDTIIISWETHDRSGRRTMAASSLENSRLGYWSPPINGEDLLIPADQSMLVISRANFRELKRVGSMQFDGQQFTLTRS